jgi:hypothetical protein
VKFSFLPILSIFHKFGALFLRRGIYTKFCSFHRHKGIRAIYINLMKWWSSRVVRAFRL